MNYKLINTITNQESICEKVTIGEFDYYITDNPKNSDWVIDSECKEPWMLQVSNTTDISKYKKVIATNKKSHFNLPKIISIESLADDLYPESLDDRDGKCNEYDTNEPVRKSFLEGYKLSQRVNSFSEEDMIGFNEWVNFKRNNFETKRDLWYWESNNPTRLMTPLELLNHWKSKQVKTIYYK